MIKILPNTKFSYNYSKGAISDRIKYCEEFNKHIFDRILQLYDKKTLCGIGVIKNSYNKFLPENKNIQISPLQARDYDKYGGGTRVEEFDGYFTGYSIEIPVNVKKKLNILELPDFMHESTHVLDYLFNPKYISNYKKMCEKRIFDKDYFEIYDRWFYNTEEMLNNNKKTMLEKAEIEIQNALEDVPFDEKLIFLTYIKYCMEMEKHAYDQGEKFAKLLQTLKKPVDRESMKNYSEVNCFDEKLAIVNRILKEEIAKERFKQLI